MAGFGVEEERRAIAKLRVVALFQGFQIRANRAGNPRVAAEFADACRHFRHRCEELDRRRELKTSCEY